MAEAGAGRITVTYRAEGHSWRLTVSDNGVGKLNGDHPSASGLGTGIVARLVRQLNGRIETAIGPNGFGTAISITGRFEHPTH